MRKCLIACKLDERKEVVSQSLQTFVAWGIEPCEVHAYKKQTGEREILGEKYLCREGLLILMLEETGLWSDWESLLISLVQNCLVSLAVYFIFIYLFKFSRLLGTEYTCVICQVSLLLCSVVLLCRYIEPNKLCQLATHVELPSCTFSFSCHFNNS